VVLLSLHLLKSLLPWHRRRSWLVANTFVGRVYHYLKGWYAIAAAI